MHTILEKAIRFWHPEYNPDRARKLISYLCPDISWHATFHLNPCMRFWVILLTEWQTNVLCTKIITKYIISRLWNCCLSERKCIWPVTSVPTIVRGFIIIKVTALLENLEGWRSPGILKWSWKCRGKCKKSGTSQGICVARENFL